LNDTLQLVVECFILLKITLMNSNNGKLDSLRRLIEAKAIDMYIIPSTDPHLGEYVPDHWRIVEWLTGFTGSAATLVITESFAGLWTDSRYFIQAEKQLSGSGFVLVNSSAGERNELSGWISENVKAGGKMALDGRIISIERIRNIEKSLEGKNLSFDYDCDLISELWTDRPAMPVSQGFEHDKKYCGRERSVKIADVREQMRKKGIDYHLLTAPEDIMWLLNIRGNDIKYSPLLISFALVAEEQVLLFIEESKIPLKLASEFDRLGIVMLPYEEAEGIISTLASGSTILLNPANTSRSLFKAIPAGIDIIEDITIPARLKAIKNSVEIENIGKTMVKDGVALTRFFYWLENEAGIADLTELSLAEKLNIFRSVNENYLSPSFSTIVAWNEHGALPH
jgi:Xaa-Pro aminopeptidase